MFSHLAGSDESVHDAYTLEQIRKFTRMTELVQSRFDYHILRHILNSAGIERFTDYAFDMVRLGIGLHGISAAGATLRPVSTFKTHIASLRRVKATETVGYGRRGHVPSGGMETATIPVGYADGIDRRLGCGAASFNVNGHRAPTVGNICMDMCMLDVTGLGVRVGDTVTVFGKDPTISELARILGTIPYEILTSVPHRIERIIVKK